MKTIFVTGGVISGLGKGIAASSIAKIMKSCGYSVTMMKLDPYLQIDAGTMSPFEHGETFVTYDGFETDLDLGHYERFIDEDLTRQSSVTTGQIYSTVISQERDGKFLGKTVQVIPHITNEIKDRILEISKNKDLTIIEIGGTIGDIEGPHFIETARQLRQEFGPKNVMFVHVVPILQVTTSGELKTKAIQHSVMKMRELGLQPDVLICRTRVSIEDELKSKIGLFCGLPKENILEGLDMKSVYSVPLMFEKQNMSHIIQKQMFDEIKEPNLSNRSHKVDKILNSTKIVNIAIAGKYTDLDDAYISVIEAIKHAGTTFDARPNIHRINTENYESDDRQIRLDFLVKENNIKGVIVPGGFGSRGIEGKISISSYCRTHNLPYLGLCLGLQVAVIAFAREIINNDKTKDILSLVNSTEFCPSCSNPVIDYMSEQKNITAKGGTMRLGAFPAILTPRSKVSDLYTKYGRYYTKSNFEESINTNAFYKKINSSDMTEIKKSDGIIVLERHRHRYEVNPKYHELLSQNGLVLSGKSPDGNLIEFIENPKNDFFVATQAHPELQSRLEAPHPLFVGFIEACLG